jgi:signal transduction histidine kinase
MVEAVLVYRAGLFVSVAASGIGALIAWRHRDHRGGRALAAVLTATLVWSGSSLCKSLAVGTPAAVTAWKLVLSSVVVVVAAFFVFALRYTGRDELVSRKTLALLAVEPVLFVTLVWTNQFHGLVAPGVAVTESGLQAVDVTFGPVLYAHTGYSYLLMTASTFLVAIYALRSRYLYQRQIAVMVVAGLVPVFANVPYTLGVLAIDPTSLALTVTGVAFTWAVTRENLLDISPIATEVVLEEIDTAVVVVDTDERVVDVNAAGRRLFRRSDGMVGENARAVLEELPTALAAYDRLAAETSGAIEEIEAAGRYYRVEMSPLTERNGDLVGRVYMLVDLTEQRRRQHELERRNEQLDRFAGVVSHDLRNPLQVASGRVELAKQTDDVSHLEGATESHERMERLIDDLLTIARDAELQPERVELATVAQSAWAVVETDGAKLVHDVDGMAVDADRTRLCQLFENLFRNSLEHGSTSNRTQSDDSVEHGLTGERAAVSGNGRGDAADKDESGADERQSGRSGSLTVRVESLSDGEGFAVCDDGPGFGDVDTEKLFEAGYTTTEDGTGFGLSIVAEVATQHGWSVTATGEPDGGACVEIRTSGSAVSGGPTSA